MWSNAFRLVDDPLRCNGSAASGNLLRDQKAPGSNPGTSTFSEKPESLMLPGFLLLLAARIHEKSRPGWLVKHECIIQAWSKRGQAAEIDIRKALRKGDQNAGLPCKHKACTRRSRSTHAYCNIAASENQHTCQSNYSLFPSLSQPSRKPTIWLRVAFSFSCVRCVYRSSVTRISACPR